MSIQVSTGPNRTHEEVVALIPALRAFSRTFYRTIDDADDLVQDTITKALGSLHQFTPETRLKSWLFTIMRNTFYTRIKRETREAPGSIDCASMDLPAQPRQMWAVKAREIAEAIQRLPPQFREAIVLVGVLDTTYADAAEICCCEIGTIKSRVNRARQMLLLDLQGAVLTKEEALVD